MSTNKFLPDIIFCFSPVKFSLTNYAKVIITISYTDESGKEQSMVIQRYADKNNVIEFDISKHFRFVFAKTQFTTVVNQESYAAKKVFVYIQKFLTHSTTSFTPQGQVVNVFYGALQVGEQYSQKRKYTCFRGLPFTVPLYKENRSDIYIQRDSLLPYQWSSIDRKYDISVNLDTSNNIKIKDQRAAYDVFDITFSNAFKESLNFTPEIDIELNVVNDNQGIYLRYLNRYGDFEYYLFKEANNTTNITNHSVSLQENTLTTSYTNGLHTGVSHPFAKNVQKSISLYAPLVDQNTFKQLEGLLCSPVVDMYTGNNNWLRVNIAPANLVRNGEALQDFNCTLLLPQTYTQTL